ncbi:MAG: restriction endonuclease [Chloroflexota bacterium]|nr:restriction endonuclease [Chloroflexota bacterium]
MNDSRLDAKLGEILSRYQKAFINKSYKDENQDLDVLMDVFGLTPDTKRENRQYWGRELGMCWQLIVASVFEHLREDFGPALRVGSDEPCDFTFDRFAVDTKYRIGSGDSGTLKKFRSYGPLLRELGYEPVFLILRTDNLPAAITACHTGTWEVLTDSASFGFIETHTGFDLRRFLIRISGDFRVER